MSSKITLTQPEGLKPPVLTTAHIDVRTGKTFLKRLPSGQRRHTVTVYVADLSRLQSDAETQGISVSALINQIIEQHYGEAK